MTSPHVNEYSRTLSVTPLGAGDLIDRAVRFYRQNFRTLLLIAAPPVIAGALVSVVWRLLGREVFGVNTGSYDERFFYYLFVWVGTMVIWFFETVATLAVMGGASRNFVRHLLFGEPLTFGETYRNVRSRLAGLIFASSLLTVLLGVIGIIDFYLGLIVATLAVFLVVAAFNWLPALAVILSVIVAGAVVFGAATLFFLIASRFAYVPQVMLVEGQGVGAAISRSSSLASGNVKRLAALFIFTTVATYSALALFYVPLAWYGWLNGVEIIANNADSIPAWYEIASQLIGQASLIILLPVWMVGLCLLYIDERVRHEGYDIELMAARSLGEIPAVPSSYVNPLQPALSTSGSTGSNVSSSYTTLGLK